VEVEVDVNEVLVAPRDVVLVMLILRDHVSLTDSGQVLLVNTTLQVF